MLVFLAIKGVTNWFESPYTEKGKPRAYRCIYFPETVVNGKLSAFAHYHKYIELLYMYNGTLELNIDEVSFTVSSGEMLILNSNESHQIKSLTKTREYVCLQFEPEILYSEDPFMSELSNFLRKMFHNDRPRILTKEVLDQSPIPSLIESIKNEWADRKPGCDIIMRSNFIAIFGWIYRYWNQNNDNKETDENGISFVDRVRFYVKKNFVTATEADAAKVCNYSLGYFSRRFNKEFGMSFREYLTKVRVKQSVNLLISTNMSITDCAEYVGFSSSSYFIKKFKEIYGMSPKKYLAEQHDD